MVCQISRFKSCHYKKVESFISYNNILYIYIRLSLTLPLDLSLYLYFCIWVPQDAIAKLVSEALVKSTICKLLIFQNASQALVVGVIKATYWFYWVNLGPLMVVVYQHFLHRHFYAADNTCESQRMFCQQRNTCMIKMGSNRYIHVQNKYIYIYLYLYVKLCMCIHTCAQSHCMPGHVQRMQATMYSTVASSWKG